MEDAMRLPLADTPAVTTVRTLVLGLLIAVALALDPNPGGAAEGAALRDGLASQVFEARRGDLSFGLEFRRDGTLTATSVFGDFDGWWMTAGDLLCTQFATGPAQGRACSEAAVASDGTVVLSNGVVLSRSAGLLPSH
jgi:hypothetical protein